jgi:hypothetical protein
VLISSFYCVLFLLKAAFFNSFQPALLALLLGLILLSEISLSWLNVSMMVRAAPSLSASRLMGATGSKDWMRQATLLALIVAAAMSGFAAQVLSVVGVCGAMCLLLANLGARTWYNLRLKPQQYNQVGANWLAYVVAILLGLVCPFLSHRAVRTGGKAAVEHALQISLWVAATIVMTSFTQVQEQLLGMTHPVSIVVVTVGYLMLYE